MGQDESEKKQANWFGHTSEELALIQRLHEAIKRPRKYRIPGYATMWWLKGVTLYLNDQRLPSVQQIRRQAQAEADSQAAPTAAAADAGAGAPAAPHV